MPGQSRMHAYFNWTKQRLDEMDATLAVLEANADHVKADSQAAAEALIADLKKRRTAFHAKVQAQAHRGEAAMHAGIAQLETQWHAFEAQLKTYFETVGKQIEHREAAFQNIAAAQARAWNEVLEELHTEAARVTAAGRADIDLAIKTLKTEAVEAETRLQRLKMAGTESWSALSTALAESRQAFDRASQQAWDAFRRAALPKS